MKNKAQIIYNTITTISRKSTATSIWSRKRTWKASLQLKWARRLLCFSSPQLVSPTRKSPSSSSLQLNKLLCKSFLSQAACYPLQLKGSSLLSLTGSASPTHHQSIWWWVGFTSHSSNQWWLRSWVTTQLMKSRNPYDKVSLLFLELI